MLYFSVCHSILLTSNASYPLKFFLTWMHTKCEFSPHTIMIDCSDTEALGINEAFKDSPVHILYCYWHLWQAWDINMKNKINVKHIRCKEEQAETLHDARVALGKLLNAATPEEFDAVWDTIEEDFGTSVEYVF